MPSTTGIPKVPTVSAPPGIRPTGKDTDIDFPFGANIGERESVGGGWTEQKLTTLPPPKKVGK